MEDTSGEDTADAAVPPFSPLGCFGVFEADNGAVTVCTCGRELESEEDGVVVRAVPLVCGAVNFFSFSK